MPRIRIIAHQPFVFEQEVEVNNEQLEELKNASERTLRDGDLSPITSLLDLTDPSGFRDFCTVEIFEVDENGNFKENGIEISA